MNETQVKYRDWELYSDKETTEQTYNDFEHSGAESCGCDYCKNFIAQRETAFPDEIKKLFRELGVDYKKEIDVSEFARLENGLHYYNGWFQFKGDFKGKDCTVPLQNGGHTFEMTKITDNFSLGFRYDNSLTPFNEKNGLVQIEFDCHLPWVLENEPE
ncbi:glutaredoxin [Psychroflexus sp. YR1-1]|uniref:Glutaredoxin n=2 Tax=Psychroflexus aurantiacus TaxID=2709310 RepID=A0A6B3R3U8_9FLAO|nr:glutaredoxin [Psychroflexus aurantiacus]